jgi:hypothetical protein
MSIQEVSAEQFAKLFHHYHHALAQDFGCRDLRDTSWQDVPAPEKSLIIAAVRLALLEISTEEKNESRRYFAKPGEAEWGC